MGTRNVFLVLAIAVTMSFIGKRKPALYQFPEGTHLTEMPIPANNVVTVEGAELGRYLFYDSILSGNRKMACATCHRQEFAFSDAPNALTRGSTGTLTRRNTMPLFNLAWYPSFFWDGRALSIEDQVLHPVRDTNEMNLSWKEASERLGRSAFYREKFYAAFGSRKIDSLQVARALGQFLRTIISYRSKFDRVLAGKDSLTNDEFAGFELMNDMTKGDCLHCHTTDADAMGTTFKYSNNGLTAVKDASNYEDKGLGYTTGNLHDNGKFKIPSLRNVALTAPYMHDGRFKTLEDVLDFYSEGVNVCANLDPKMGSAYQGGVHITQDEKQKIIAFLHTLTDSALITDKQFANPFNE